MVDIHWSVATTHSARVQPPRISLPSSSFLVGVGVVGMEAKWEKFPNFIFLWERPLGRIHSLADIYNLLIKKSSAHVLLYIYLTIPN